jgi:hypothetical protein
MQNAAIVWDFGIIFGDVNSFAFKQIWKALIYIRGMSLFMSSKVNNFILHELGFQFNLRSGGRKGVQNIFHVLLTHFN